MVRFRRLFPALVGAVLSFSQLGAQDATGTITGRVIDGPTQQPLGSVTIQIVGTTRGTLSRPDGNYTLSGVPAGTHRLRTTRIGYASMSADVTVAAGGTATADFTLTPAAVVLEEIVSVGYGTQRREAVTGSVATVSADDANVGVVANVNQLLQARVAGVQTTQNSGEPGGGVQVRIRGGTSISASNEPLYVVDGVPLFNEESTPQAAGIGSINRQLARNPLNSISPNDIESISVLKDASATAIYGSRAANGVVLITTKRGTASAGQMEYDGYVAASAPARELDFLTGDQYRQFVGEQVDEGNLPATAETSLGTANTDWEDEVMRPGFATNHNVAFSGGVAATQYRASLNYFDQRGVVLSSGLTRYQGRLNANHNAFQDRLQLALNLMAARVNNDYAPIENTGGFLGGLFTNMAIFNPTHPVRAANGRYFEVGTGVQDLKNPVALANQFEDDAPENRVLSNLTGTLTVLPELLSAQTTLGVDYTDAVRRTFAPRESPVGAQYGGYARQAQRSLQNLNFQQLITLTPRIDLHDVEVVGGYEYSTYVARGFGAQMQGFITDIFDVDNLGAGTQGSSPVDTSYNIESKLVSFFGRANYGFADRYFISGVLRYDGSSRLAPGHQWSLFPGIAASWRLSEEPFMSAAPYGISTLALRLGWGKQGNQSVAPYQTQLLLRVDPSAAYPFGGRVNAGVRAAQVGNDSLKWETATQTNFGIDFGVMEDRVTGTIDIYQKDTKDLLLEVSVPQPAVVDKRIENVGTLRNRGVEMAIDAQLWSRAQTSVTGGLVLTVERNEVTSLGGNRQSINTGFVSGQGQSGQYAQRIMVGEPIGTFFAPQFLRVNDDGQQVFSCRPTSAGCTNGETISPTDDDRVIAGDANPDFTVGLRNNATWGRFDASWLWRGEFGGKVFNNTALVYQTKSNAKQGRNFLTDALSDPDDINEPAKYSTRWIEDRTFVRLQNVTVGYTFNLPTRGFGGQSTRVYLAGDNLLLLTDYSGYDPEVFVSTGLASRSIDYLTYPRARSFTFGAGFQF
jgi:iron complex outermembrane receptor protein